MAIVLSVLLRLTASDYPLVSCGHCVVCPSVYGFWLPLWYLVAIVLSVLLRFTASDYPFGILAIVLSVLLRFTASDYPFGILWPLYCLSFFGLRLLITPLVSCGHCVVCPSVYGFWLPLWYLVAIVLSVLRFTASDYPFGILWPLCCLFFGLRLLITPLISCGHCVVCPSVYGFWLPLWYLVAIVLSVLLRLTASDYPLVSCGHCVVCSSSAYGFWLSLWYLVAIVLSVLQFTASDYPFGILWPLCCLSFFGLRLLITPLVSCGHCVVCPSVYGFWLPLWYIVAIVLSVLLRLTASDYPLISCGHCVVCPSVYGFWLPLWYHVAIVLSVLLRLTASDYPLVSCGHCVVCPSVYASDYPFGILWPLCCLFFFGLRLLFTPLVSCDHCVVSPSSVYGFWLPLWYLGHCVVCLSVNGFWLPLWYLVAIVLSVFRFTASDYPFGILWPVCCLFFFGLRLLSTPLVSCGHCIVCPSSAYGFWLSFGILWPLYCLSFDLRLLITPLVSCGHCVVCLSVYGFWLSLWYLVAIVLSVLLRFTASEYPFSILWPLYCLSFFGLRLLIILWYLVAIVLSVLRFTASDYPFGILWPLCCLSFGLRLLITPLISCGHCIVCSSSVYGFWLPLWYLVAIVLSVFRFTASDYPFGILYLVAIVLSVLLRLTASDYPLVSCGHCVVCPSVYGFWLPLWYFVAIVLPVLRFTLLITPLISCGHCVVCPSVYGFWLPLWYLGHCVVCLSVYGFWLPLWYLVAIVLSVFRFTASDYPFGILWPVCCLFFFGLRLLSTPLVSCGHCIVCPSSAYGFWLSFGILWPLYCLSFGLRLLITPLVSCCIVCHCYTCLSIVLSRFTASDYPFGILWPLCCLFFFGLRLLSTPLVSCGHCIVCPSSAYGFWLSFGILWPLYCLSFGLRLLITPLVSCGHCVVCPSVYGFWLPLWYLVAIVLSVLLRFTASDYPFGILWPLCCLSFGLRLLIIPLVSCGHCVVCSSSAYGFWLPLWYIGHCSVCPSSVYGFWLPL